jgi:tetratricopeptide (TPR) repeat protein
MASNDASRLPPITPEHRRAAAGQYERANQVIATGNFDYGIQLLLSCCKLDPGNLIYRQSLRRTEKAKYKNNMRGTVLAGLRTWTRRARIKAAKRTGDYVKVLEHGEQVLAFNPWETRTQMDMAEAADALGLLDLAVWTLEQARQKNPQDLAVNRSLARLYEKRGNFTQAIALWELIRKALPRDIEAQDKATNLAASETIARGHYDEVVPHPESDEEDAEQPEHKPGVRPADGKAPGRLASDKLPTSHESRAGGRATDGKTPDSQPDKFPSAFPADRADRGEVGRLKARIDADPTNANAYLHLASHYRRLGQLDQAREVLQQGLAPSGNHFELSLELADLEIEPFRNNLNITEEKLRTNPQDEELRRIRIRLRKEINSRELELYRQKADRYPTELGNRFELGLRLLRAGQTDEAIRELQAARADPRNHWRALLYLGYCFKNRNNWRLAKRNFEESLQQMPPGEDSGRKEVLFQLAQGAADAAEWTVAIDMAHELANLDFTYNDIGRLLDEWTARMHQANAPK